MSVTPCRKNKEKLECIYIKPFKYLSIFYESVWIACFEMVKSLKAGNWEKEERKNKKKEGKN